MYFQYGNYRFGRDSTKVERSYQTIAPAGVPLWEEWTWNCTTVLNPDIVGGTTAEQIAYNYAATDAGIYRALQPRNGRASLITDGGVEVMYLRPASFPGERGPTIQFQSNPVGDGTEFAGMRTISFAITARYVIGDLSRILTAFNETLTLRGTGQPPKVVKIGMVASVIQYPRAASMCYAVQSGSATGAVARPTWAVPKPLWLTTDYDGDQTQVVHQSGQRNAESLTNFTISWSYSFSRPGKPFVGVPHEFN